MTDTHGQQEKCKRNGESCIFCCLPSTGGEKEQKQKGKLPADGNQTGWPLPLITSSSSSTLSSRSPSSSSIGLIFLRRFELVGNPGGNKQRPCLGGFPTNGELCHPRRGLKYFQIERIFPSFPIFTNYYLVCPVSILSDIFFLGSHDILGFDTIITRYLRYFRFGKKCAEIAGNATLAWNLWKNPY